MPRKNVSDFQFPLSTVRFDMDSNNLGGSLSSLPSTEDETSSIPNGLLSPSKARRTRSSSIGSLVGSPYEETFPLDFRPPQREKLKVRTRKRTNLSVIGRTFQGDRVIAHFPTSRVAGRIYNAYFQYRKGGCASVPKKILLLEDVAQVAVQKLQGSGYEVEALKVALSEEELKEKIRDVHAIGIRSRTPLNAAVLAHAEKLLCIGCFCIGTDKVDLSAATMKGVPVFNSPYQNSRSVAELIISMIINLARQTGDRNMEMHNGVWKKTARGCLEIRGKTLGIVGYGHIGSQLSVLAESMGMRVIFYDTQSQMPLGNSKPAHDLSTLLSSSDFVTLHVPQTPETKNMITKKEIAQMPQGSFLLNASRGTVVQIPDLIDALKSGHLSGAYLDVYPEEPAENGPTDLFSQLATCPNTIMSPHIGGSTTEAQIAIGEEVAHRFASFISTGNTYGSVNFPTMDLAYSGEGTHRIINVHANKPGVLKEINNILSVYNIEGQTLRTQKNIGYFIVDVDSQFSDEIRERIAALDASIKTRIVY